MASNNSGTNFFIPKVRSIAKFDVDTTTGEIFDISRAPLKGRTQTQSSYKVLNIFAKDLRGNIKKIQKNFNDSTNWIGHAVKSSDWQNGDEDTTKTYQSFYKLNSNGVTSELHNATNETNISSLSVASLATEKEKLTNVEFVKIRFKVPKPKPQPIIIKFQLPKILRNTTENNGINEIVAPKNPLLKLDLSDEGVERLRPKRTPRLRLDLSKEDQEKLRPKRTPRLKLNLSKEDRERLQRERTQPLSPLDLLSINQLNTLRRMHALPLVQENVPAHAYVDSKANSAIRFHRQPLDKPTKQVLTDFQAINWDSASQSVKEDSVDPLKDTTDRLISTLKADNKHHNSSRYYTTIIKPKKTEKEPILVDSQLQAIRNELDTRAPKQWPCYEKVIRGKAAKVFQSAQEAVDLKSNISTLIKAQEQHGQALDQSSNTKHRHVLSAVPIYMCMPEKYSNHITLASGRIEYGTEASWTVKKRNFQELAPAPESDIERESSPKRLRIRVKGYPRL